MLPPQRGLIAIGLKSKPKTQNQRVFHNCCFSKKSYSRNCQTLGVPHQRWGFTYGKLSRSGFELYDDIQKKLVIALRKNKLIQERVQRLMSIPGVGEVTALTWVLEIGEPRRFSSSRHVISYCGLCSAQHESAGKEQRSPISKQRNKHLQTILIEAAKLAPHWNEQLALLHEKELARGNRNRATLAVARKLVEFMMAVDRRETEFETMKLAA